MFKKLSALYLKKQHRFIYIMDHSKTQIKISKTRNTKPIKIKYENRQNSEDIVKKARNSADKSKNDDSEKLAVKWEPKNWQSTLEYIKEMRKNNPAPVDTMGCDKCSDENASEKDQRYHILVSLMLSSQTKDQITYEAMQKLKNHGLTPENIVITKANKLEELLTPVGFYKNKAKYLIKTSQILIDKYESDIPKSIAGLISLPGVGPKMAHICMKSAWNIVTGIGVDTHVHRISNRLRWLKKKTKEPEGTRKSLEEWLPIDLWDEINLLLVGFGQTICTPISPKCSICLNRSICPSNGIKKGF